mgnify:CR=1 FL=1
MYRYGLNPALGPSSADSTPFDDSSVSAVGRPAQPDRTFRLTECTILHRIRLTIHHPPLTVAIRLPPIRQCLLYQIKGQNSSKNALSGRNKCLNWRWIHRKKSSGELVMQILAKCPRCGQVLQLSPAAADRRIRCPRCYGLFSVPGPAHLKKAVRVIKNARGRLYVDQNGNIYG